MKKNEIRIYLKQDIKSKLDYLAYLCDMPTSKLIRVMIEEPIFQQTIDSNISMIESLKRKQPQGIDKNQMEFDFNDK